jgi:hypothetical protein
MTAEARHVPVEELASGRLGASGREHLRHCADCQQQLREWAATRDAVDLMISDSRPPEGLIDDVLAIVTREPINRRARRPASRWRAGRERRARLAAAAAVLVVVAGGAGYGIYDLAGSPGRSLVQPAAVTAVAGCSGLESVTGTLQTIEGSTLVIRSADGSTVRITTAVGTHTIRQQSASMAAIRDGEAVIVTGTYSDGSLKAARVGQLSAVPPVPSSADAARILNQGQAVGTLADLAAGRFAVVEPGGNRVAVTTSSSTRVIATLPADPARLQIGARTAAVGKAGPNGTLVASTLDQQALPLHLVGPPTAPIAGAPSRPASGTERSRSPLGGLGCDPATVATAALILTE